MTETTLYRYSGAGNTFIIIYSTEAGLDISLQKIVELCSRDKGFGTDGFIILEPSETHDFRMRFYNNDGSSGMMCGNGGRCIVDLADRLGLTPSGPDHTFIFEAPDGLHSGRIISRDTANAENVVDQKERSHIAEETNGKSQIGTKSTVSISMRPVSGIEQHILTNTEGKEFTAYRMNTGTDHLVIFRDSLERFDIIEEGRRWRYDQRFAPKGVNVNFVCKTATPNTYTVTDANAGTGIDTGNSHLCMRTYEKGVEDETLACGTGVIAAALADYISKKGSGTSTYAFAHTQNHKPSPAQTECSTHPEATPINTPQSCEIKMGTNTFQVSFRPTLTGFTDIHLQGPVELLVIVE